MEQTGNIKSIISLHQVCKTFNSNNNKNEVIKKIDHDVKEN